MALHEHLPPIGATAKETAEWYIRRWEKRTGKPWPQSQRPRLRLPGDKEATNGEA